MEYNVKCLEKSACKDANITCAKGNNNCNIISENINSLQNAIINGALNSTLSVNCSGYVSDKLIIDCRDISGGIRGCEDMNIYCLEQTYISRKLHYHEALLIYAINSWDNIDLTLYTNVDISSSSKK